MSALPNANTHLNSWKEIAAYVGRGVRTVQRWEQELQFPVRRPRGRKRSAVIALSHEIDEWLAHSVIRQPIDGGSPSRKCATVHIQCNNVAQTAHRLLRNTQRLQINVTRALELAARNLKRRASSTSA
jgi:predicted DNA-binding transcriptional regulator AlpA